jgi:1-acyl-sn-glycerol-3-phosphate acyltransferase
MQAGQFARRVTVARPGWVTPTGERGVRLLGPLVRRLFRPTCVGFEHLPAGPYLLVANHSAGMGVAEILSIVTCWHQAFGTGRPLAGFALPLGFVVWPLSWVHRQIGTIPSTYPAAFAALAQGVPILVFPGGDHESLTPIWHRAQVDFGGRIGFLKIARQSQVPVVPLAIAGGPLTSPILLRSRLLATLLVVPRLMGLKRWGISLLGLLGAGLLAAVVPWSAWLALAIFLWLGSPFPFLPLFPATIRMVISPPLPPPAPDATDADLQFARVALERRMEALLTRFVGGE